MSSLADPHVHEIIIVKHRNSDDDEGHHGGAWKIAFADFMTAMMCFFLVMWLINAANEETKAAVASYFNPVKLIDRNSNRRGLDDIGNGPQSHSDGEDKAEKKPEKAEPTATGSGKAENQPSKDDAQARKTSDDHLFSDPYAVLAEIAGDSGQNQNVSVKGDGGAQIAGPATGASGGEAYRDPFAPDFWAQDVLAGAPAGQEETATDPSEPAAKPARAASRSVEPMMAEPQAAEAGSAPAEPVKADSAIAEPAKPAVVAGSAPPEPLKTAVPLPTLAPQQQDMAAAVEPKPQAEGAKPGKPSTANREAAREIGKAIEEAFGPSDRIGSGISVVPDKGGVKISLTDQLDFGMFELGQATPRRELVLAMAKIGRILASRPGTVSIHGHTDARPFAGKTYDNWRLSTARAQAAYYMLVRGGLDEHRVGEVAGHADRDLKLKDKPFDPANRRIEIILETGA